LITFRSKRKLFHLDRRPLRHTRRSAHADRAGGALMERRSQAGKSGMALLLAAQDVVRRVASLGSLRSLPRSLDEVWVSGKP